MPDKQPTLRELEDKLFNLFDHFYITYLGDGTSYVGTPPPDRQILAEKVMGIYAKHFASHLEGLAKKMPKTYKMTRTFDQAMDSYDDAREFGQEEGYNEYAEVVQSIIKEEADSLTKNTNA